MFGPRGDELLVGAVALVIAGLLAIRIVTAARTGEVPLYRTRLKRAEAGAAKFNALVGLNAVLLFVMLAIGIDLLVG